MDSRSVDLDKWCENKQRGYAVMLNELDEIKRCFEEIHDSLGRTIERSLMVKLDLMSSIISPYVSDKQAKAEEHCKRCISLLSSDSAPELVSSAADSAPNVLSSTDCEM